ITRGLFFVFFFAGEGAPVLFDELANVVKFFAEGETDALGGGGGFVDEVFVGAGVGAGAQGTAGVEFYIEVEVAHHFTGVGLVLAYAHVAVDGYAVVEELGADGHFKFFAGDVVAGAVGHTKVEVVADGRHPAADLGGEHFGGGDQGGVFAALAALVVHAHVLGGVKAVEHEQTQYLAVEFFFARYVVEHEGFATLIEGGHFNAEADVGLLQGAAEHQVGVDLHAALQLVLLGTAAGAGNGVEQIAERGAKLVHGGDVDFGVVGVALPFYGAALVNDKLLVDEVLQRKEVFSLLNGVVAKEAEVALAVDAYLKVAVAGAFEDVADALVEDDLHFGIGGGFDVHFQLEAGKVHTVVGRLHGGAIAVGVAAALVAYKANEVGFEGGFGGADGDEKAGVGLGATVDGEADVVEHAVDVQVRSEERRVGKECRCRWGA